MTSTDNEAGAPACRHIMLPNENPLCGQATASPEQLPPDAHAEMTTDQFTAWLDENLDAPACGPCLMLAGNLRFQASVLRRSARERVHPPRPQDAWRLLADTAWGEVIDIRSSLPRMERLKMGYSWSDFEVDDEQVEQRLADRAGASQRERSELLERHAREASARRDGERPDYENL